MFFTLKKQALLKKCEELEKESRELVYQAAKCLDENNNKGWEDCFRASVEKEAFARGIKEAIKQLGI